MFNRSGGSHGTCRHNSHTRALRRNGPDGTVYYANYHTWFEIRRTEFCRALSAVEAHVRCKNPLRYDERALIETRITEVTSHSISFSCRVKPEERSRLAAEGWTRHAFYSWLMEQTRSSAEEVVLREH
ncbi:MAG: hotdog domain-containing protein [Thermovirgaceae bacterium]|nr:hotdog domain-containing protein [Thermovirgaceae bacterium]